MRFASKMLFLILGLVFAFCGAAQGQQPINPVTQIRWPLVTGNGTPTTTGAVCDATHYGQPYQNTAVNPNTFYTCGTDGWAIRINPVTFKGTWDPAVTYSQNDGAFYNGSTYVSLKNNNLNQNPSTAATYWTLLVNGSGGGSPSGPAGGDLGGTYPNPTVASVSPAALGGAQGRAAVTVVVGASDSPNKAYANVVATGVDDQNTIMSAITANCPRDYTVPTNISACTVHIMKGHYYLSAPIVINTDDVTIEGEGHPMWGGYNRRWVSAGSSTTAVAGRTITAWTITSNVACFTNTGTNSLVANEEVVLLNFITSTFFNNFTGRVNASGLTTTNFCINFTHANGSGTETAGFVTPTGSISNGNTQLVATTAGFPIFSFPHTLPCGNGDSDTVRCRGWKITHVYGVCYGYSNDFLNATAAGSGDDNVMVDDNVMQRCRNGVVGSFDSPTLSNNSFQDNSGHFFSGGGLYLRGQNNLIYDDGGNAYNVGSLSGCTIQDRAWGDLAGGFIGSVERCAITGNVGFQVGPTGFIVLKNIHSTTVTGNSSASGSGNCISMDNTQQASSVLDTFTVSGNVCAGYTQASAGDMVGLYGIQNVATTGNSFNNDGTLVGGAAVNAATCTNCTVTGNVAPGKWNYGGPPITLSATALGSNNLTNFTVNQGIASITSAYLLGRYQASGISPNTNGSTITSWADSSTLANNSSAVFGTPTYISASPINSGPAASFNGSSGVYFNTVFASSTANARTIWIVFNQTAAGTAGQTPTLWTSGGNGLNAVYFNGTSNALSIYTGVSQISSIVPTLNATHVLEVVINTGTNASRIVLDGNSGTSATFTAGSSASGPQMGIGSKGNIANNYFTGYIAEEAYYNGANTNADAATLGAAYCSTYGVSCGVSW